MAQPRAPGRAPFLGVLLLGLMFSRSRPCTLRKLLPGTFQAFCLVQLGKESVAIETLLRAKVGSAFLP